jgi:hypothetical protein
VFAWCRGHSVRGLSFLRRGDSRPPLVLLVGRVSDQSKPGAAPLNDSLKCGYGRALLLMLAPLALTSIRSLLFAER